MSEIQTFKIEEKVYTIDDLYDYILGNVDFVGKYVGIRTEKPMTERPFCITEIEENTLFYAVQETSPDSFGELIILTSAFRAGILVFLLEPMNWLHSICKDKNQIILGEVKVGSKRLV